MRRKYWRIALIALVFSTFASSCAVVEPSTATFMWQIRSQLSTGSLRASRTSPGRLDSGITYKPGALFASWTPPLFIDLACGRIEYLNLAHQSTTPVFQQRRFLPHLKILIADHTDLTDSELLNISGCTMLERLSVSKTSVTVRGLEAFFAQNGSPELEQLDLYGTGVSDDVATAVGSLKQLKVISLSGTQVTDKTAFVLSKLPNLERIGVSHTEISSSGIASFSHLPKLTVLYADGLTSLRTPDVLAGLTQLERLSLEDTPLTADGVRAIATLPRLKSLTLDGSTITDDVLPVLLSCKEIRYLSLARTGISDESIDRMRELKPHVKISSK
eukprot:TRINITY_DN30_c0_g2_i7.p1 TRINITY_DN30_c0_g2~~TRINITY_DN30_c0_g2_i7.p1  ORF type:complete len:331 (-),score=1.65 TRINITY_DN30_c0_g2_i7:44-1036(-)